MALHKEVLMLDDGVHLRAVQGEVQGEVQVRMCHVLKKKDHP